MGEAKGGFPQGCLDTGPRHSKGWLTGPQEGPEMAYGSLGKGRVPPSSWEVILDLTFGGQRGSEGQNIGERVPQDEETAVWRQERWAVSE